MRSQRTRVHGGFLYCRHGTQFRYTDLPPADEIVILDPDSQAGSGSRLLALLAALCHSQAKRLLGTQGFGWGGGGWLVLGKELVFPLRVLHPPGKGSLSRGGRST